jgi:polynucleotide 5'-hydroxyl-kinase GRC3/NOL9
MLNMIKLFSNKDGPRGIFVHPITSPPEWNEAISTSVSKKNRHGKPTSVLVCGPKSSGKSTFSRLLSNRFLSADEIPGSTEKKARGIAFLDLDPGQPEYGPPGHLSLVYVSQLNLGPPYSHPLSMKGRHEVIRAHSIAALSPASDPTLYMECVRNLLVHYRSNLLAHKKCPLIINTPGWVLGTGLEILVDIVGLARPAEIIYMSQDGPSNVVKALKDVCDSAPMLTLLPSQVTEYTARTPAHLRHMQAMSYFHVGDSEATSLYWNPDPLTSIPPFEVKYGGGKAGILGILCLGEHPPPNMLLETITGTLLSVVVVEDMTAITGPEIHQDEFYSGSPLILFTPEKIPYLNPSRVLSQGRCSWDPTKTQTIGLALLRGVDERRQTLQLLTPISSQELMKLNQNGTTTVLISGKLDAPGWAYTEELYRRAHNTKIKTNDRVVLSEHQSNESESKGNPTTTLLSDEIPLQAFDEVPWIEIQQGDQGRGVGGRVWRVRRDLGKA